MNKLKFYIIRIAINLLFVCLMCYFFVYGMNNNGMFHVIPASVLLVAGCVITYYNIPTKGLLNSTAELAVCAAMYFCYLKATVTEYDILASDMGFIRLIRGTIVLVGAIIIMKLFQQFVLPLLKYAEIYCGVNDTGIMASAVGCMANFDSTLAIPAFDSILRKSFKEIFDTVQSSGVVSNDSEEPSKFNNLLDNLQDTSLVQASKGLLKIYSEYPDECILAYCYKYPDVPIYKATLQATGIFLKNAPLIMGQIAALYVIGVAIRVILWVVVAVFVIKYGVFTLTNIFLYAMLGYSIQFILCNAIYEPILMNTIISTFLQKAEECEDDFEEEVKSFMPNLGKLKKLFGLGDEDLQESAKAGDFSEKAEEFSEKIEEVSEKVEETIENTGSISVDDVKI